uniref:Amino acid transporter transmembrane domain-containing protein n=1 Tax=Ditylenchus dipsaci TaxID=166011 RepID=A0A915D5L6_9BILA
MTLAQDDQRIEDRIRQTDPENLTAISPGNVIASTQAEDTHLFSDRPHNANSITPEQAFVHMVKAMLGTGLLSLPYAFMHSGLYLGLFLLVIICIVCLYCMRQIVYAAHFVCKKNGRELIDYANIMRGAVEAGPPGSTNMAISSNSLLMSKCSLLNWVSAVYTSSLWLTISRIFSTKTPACIWQKHLFYSQTECAGSICVCGQHHLFGCGHYCGLLFLHPSPIRRQHHQSGGMAQPSLFFGTVMFAFEGVCVVMPIENRMEHPKFFISWNGVLNSSCLVVLAIFAVTGFYGYLAFGQTTMETVTLNLPPQPFYEMLKLMFVACVMVSYPLQFFVPMERIEKFITRKCAVEKQMRNVYFARFSIVLATCAIAEMVPHLALFISLVGAVACTSLALLFPPFIDLLVCYAQNKLSPLIYIRNFGIFIFAMIGFGTGTYSALRDIFLSFA